MHHNTTVRNRSIQVLEKAIRLNPFPPAYWIRDLGEAYRMGKRYEEAITEFKRAIQVNSHYLEAHVSLVCTYTLIDRGNDAEAAASRVLNIAPYFSVEDYAKALPYKQKKDLNCMIAALRKAGLN